MAAMTVSLVNVALSSPMAVSTTSTPSSAGDFDEAASDFIAKNRGKLLIEAVAKDHLGRNSIYISARESGERGFGTASTRFVFKTSLERGYGGRFHNIAAMSSHLFHLYMGMIPVDEEISHVRLYWGTRGEKILRQADDIITALEIHKPLEGVEKSYLTVLKRILSDIRRVLIETITDEEIIKAREEFKIYAAKKVSYLKEEFIPSLLNILERGLFNPHLNTSSLSSVRMVVSEEGIERWKTAVNNRQTFVPFKKLEQLRPHMSPEQLTRLDKIMEVRAKISKSVEE